MSEFNNNFKKLTHSELKKMSIDELVKYYKAQRKYIVENDAKIERLMFRKLFHPVMYAGLLGLHKLKKYEFEINGEVPKTKRPIIYATSHIGLLDIEAALHAIKKHAYIFADDEEFMYRTFDGLLFELNGSVYIDNEDTEDKKISFGLVKKLLKTGESVLWFPERTWNLSPNYVILPMLYGIIEAAWETDALIIPIGVEQYDLDKNKKFVVNIGEAIDLKSKSIEFLTKQTKIELLEELRGEMASLLFKTWEEIKRDDIPDDYFENYINTRINEWPYYTIEMIEKMRFEPRKITTEEKAFEHLKNINFNKNNAFLAKQKKDYEKVYCKKNY